MLIIIARIEFDPARMDTIEPALDAMMRATWEDTGCLSYSMAIENRAEGICTIVERWASEASLKSHFASAHMARFVAAIEGAARSTDAMMYDVVNERPLVL